MAIYEKRSYSIIVGKMPDVIQLYSDVGWPALKAVGCSDYLVGYFTSDTGTLSQLIHLWRFADDQDRRAFWKRLSGNEATQVFLRQLRPMLLSQEVQLLNPAPWGPAP